MVSKISKDLSKAFANSQRVNLLTCLSKKHSVTELLSKCYLSQSALSQHLKVLRDSGAVTSSKEGKNVYYQVKSKQVLSIAQSILKLIKI